MPRWMYQLAMRCRSLFWRSRVESELDEELRLHFEQLVQEHRERGLSFEDARRQATLVLGGVEQQKDACRDTRGVAWVDHLLRDTGYALRLLRRSPGFASVALVSLALGIGANTAIFQLIDAVRLRPLPVSRPEELAQIRIDRGNGGFGLTENSNSQLTFPLWEQIAQHQRAFSRVFAWGTTPILVGAGADARIVGGLWMSGDAFSTLGVTPALGRLFDPSDDVRGCAPAVVLNHAFWAAQLGSDPSAIGRSLTVLNREVPIVGVTAPDFFGLEVGQRFDIALPVCAAAAFGSPIDRRDWFWLSAMGRLNPGWTVARAAEHITAISPALVEATLPMDRDRAGLDRYRSFRLTALRAAEGVSRMRADYGDALSLLLALTGLVLLMACTNLMNLFLGRASAREQEIAVRIALGASRRRVIAQLFVEGLVVAMSGTAVAAGLAPLFSRGLLALVTTDSNRLHLTLGANWPVLLFTAGIGTIACLVFGLVPALRASQLDPSASMKTGSRGLTSGRRRMAIQRGLVAAQAALSLVLVVGAGLFVRSFTNLIAVDTGFNRRGVTLARLGDFVDRPNPDAAFAAQQELLERVRRVPLVEAAATTTKVPLDSSSWTMAFFLPATNESQRRSSKFTYVSPQYFSTVGMRLLAGRDFTDADLPAGRQVAIVNETFVRRFLPSAAPVGTQIRTAGEPRYPARTYDIIGVVSDTKYSDLRGDILPITFVPIAQHPSPPAWPNLVLRSSAPPDAVIAAVRRAITELRPHMVMGFTVLDTQVRETLVRERLLAWLAGGFGVLAAIVATIGVYGVVSYLIVRRRLEIAIRMALGAGRGQVVGLILRETGLLVAAGLGVGTALTLIAARSASGLLFGLSPYDPATLAGAVILLAIMAAAASAVPALRASRIDATAALRSD
jgi:putative ABC transport system permease protein